MTLYRCDKCKKEIDVRIEIAVEDRFCSSKSFPIYFDFCSECLGEFEDMLKTFTKEEPPQVYS